MFALFIVCLFCFCLFDCLFACLLVGVFVVCLFACFFCLLVCLALNNIDMIDGSCPEGAYHIREIAIHGSAKYAATFTVNDKAGLNAMIPNLGKHMFAYFINYVRPIAIGIASSKSEPVVLFAGLGS